MERNEACGLTAFGAFEMGLGVNIDNSYKINKSSSSSSSSSSAPPASSVVSVSGGSTAVAVAATADVSGKVDRDLVAAARFDFLKKKRMPRFRRGASAATGRPFRPFASFATPLTASKPAETHLPALIAKEGIVLEMDDMDGMNVWCFKFRFWPNNNSRMYVLEGTGDFAEEHELQVGDYIMLYRDSVNLNYVIQAVKAYEVEEYSKKDVKSNLSIVKAPPNNGGFMNQNSSWSGLEVELLNPINYPLNVSTADEQMGMTFVYDTSYSNDTMTPLDFLGGFMTSYPTAQPNFAIENLSFDDLYKI